MSYNDVSYEWTKKGCTLSDKTAFKEFGLTQDDIIKAINEGNLQFREGSIYGIPILDCLDQKLKNWLQKNLGKICFIRKRPGMN